MNFKNEDILDLNEENIKALFAYCLATKDANPKNVLSTRFVEKSPAHDISDMYFLIDRIREKSNTILYLLGQLKVIHDRKAIMKLSEGFFKYDGTTWTQNKMLLFALYYLGNAASCFPLFYVGDDIIFGFLENYPELKPTLSPNDPNYTK